MLGAALTGALLRVPVLPAWQLAGVGLVLAGLVVLAAGLLAWGARYVPE